ncbi:MAG: osmotically-inducible protein OsmY [Alphaproteobacteria bacterium]|jgi:osmotically-inducible protein OsmY
MRPSILVPLALGLCILSPLAPTPAQAQLMDILTGPKTLIDRAIEARKSKDIFEDNRIVIDVNKVMANLGTIKASTEIYEQKILITAIFDDKATYDKFRAGVNKVKGIKQLYWHVRYMSEQDQKSQKAQMVDWKMAIVIATKVRANLIGTRGVSDVNFRTAVDSFGTVYLLGRARSQEEMKKTLAVIAKTPGVKKVVNYGHVRP